MLVLIDNYDSFTYNLYHYLLENGTEVEVHRNDAIDVQTIIKKQPEGIILSPGPCYPKDAGICMELIDTVKNSIPILGVCLGHQAIGQVFGGKVIRGEKPMHAVISSIKHTNHPLFADIPESFNATRYHSLIVETSSLPDSLIVTATSDDGVIQGLSHKEYNVHGVQFHPESIASEYGHQILRNFNRLCTDPTLLPTYSKGSNE